MNINLTFYLFHYMKNKRRDFLKLTSLTGLGVFSGGLSGVWGAVKNKVILPLAKSSNVEATTTVIGAYGQWAAGLNAGKLPSMSFRNNKFTDVNAWRKLARKRLAERLAPPSTGKMPQVTVKKQYIYDGLQIEELSWQLPYGPPTDAILLKPANAKGKLPGILAFHDHGGLKYFGTRKITKTSDNQHPLIVAHQAKYYSSLAWANEVAKRGYVVLVSDAFPFASRRVLMKDMPVDLRNGLSDEDPEKTENVNAYNEWALSHEHTMSKSLFSAGTTWPGVFLAEDRAALDILCSRVDVDANNIACGGLSGGGMRTVFMGGYDERIKCCVCVGFMTTWKDFVLNRAPNHTWMTYVPLSPNELDFPEILGLRVPLPTMVLNNYDDELYTPGEMKGADTIMGELFTKAKAPDHYKCSFHPGPHKFDAKMQAEAFAWFDKWLKA
jgi:dienelactone hydrolase